MAWAVWAASLVARVAVEELVEVKVERVARVVGLLVVGRSGGSRDRARHASTERAPGSHHARSEGARRAGRPRRSSSRDHGAARRLR